MRRKMMFGAMVVAMVVAMATLATACGSSSSSTGSSGGSKDGGGVSTGGTAKGTPIAVDVGDTTGVTGPMTMTASPASVPAGKVTFTLKNAGTIEHEMIVVKTDTPFDQLKVTDGKVSEADSQGEVPELAVGKTGTVTLDLTAGQYVLGCNIKDHYPMGMRVAFTVT